MEMEETSDEVTTFTVQIPSVKLEVDEGFPRGTIINMNLALRVRYAFVDESKSGVISQHHVLVLEEATFMGKTTPAERRAAFEAAEAALAAEEAKSKTIQEYPDAADLAPEPEVAEEVAVEDAEWTDVDKADEAKRAVLSDIEEAEVIEEFGGAMAIQEGEGLAVEDEDQFEQAPAPQTVDF